MFKTDGEKLIKNLPNGDVAEITSTQEGFRVKVYYTDDNGKRRPVYSKHFRGGEITGIPRENDE